MDQVLKEGWKIKGYTTVHCHTGSMRQKKVLKRDILTSHIAFEINTKLEMAGLPLHLLNKSVLLYDPYRPVRAFIAKVLRKSPFEGRM